MTHTTNYEHVLDAANVRGVSYEADRDEVVVFVEEKLPESSLADDDIVANQIPDKQTDVVEIGDVTAQPRHPPEVEKSLHNDPTGHRTDHDPPLAGASEIQAGATAATAGVLATVAEPTSETASWHDSIQEGDLVRLSNAHVYGDSDAEFTADVVQPSPYDGGGTPDDRVGDFVGYVPIEDEFVDVAARTCSGAEASGVLRLRESGPEAVRRDDYEALNGEPVVKAGRTTGVTEGEIIATSASIRVRYGNEVITKRNQLLASAMSQGGDSGSPVFEGTEDEPGALVGHLFAGSDQVTVINKALDIETRLGVRIKTVDDQDHVSEYTFEDAVEDHLVEKYGEPNVHRQHRFSNDRYADFLVQDDGVLWTWELENDSGSLVNGMGQALFYAQSALEDWPDADGAIPVLCFPEGHIDEEERALFEQAGVVLQSFQVPEDVSLKGV